MAVVNSISSRSSLSDDTIVIFDLDGTITYRDTYLDFLLYCLRKNPFRILGTWRLPIDVILFKLGLRDNSWLKERFLSATLGGCEFSEIKMWANGFVDKLIRSGIKTSAKTVLDQHRKAAHKVFLVSASFDLYIGILADRLGFHEVICTHAEWDSSGRLTGRIKGANCYGIEKLLRLEKRFSGDRASYNIIAYTDHHSDLPLLEWVDVANAVDPSRKLERAARTRNYQILHWK